MIRDPDEPTQADPFKDYEFYIHKPPRDPRGISKHHKWRFGHGPEDDEARGEGFEPTEIVLEPPPAELDPYENIIGTPTRLKCPRCQNAEMQVVDTKYKGDELEGAEVPENLLLLRCPGCKYYMQVRESVVRIVNERRANA